MYAFNDSLEELGLISPVDVARPLPDETKAKSAKDLIARFQTSINTTGSTEPPLKSRNSFGSNEVSKDAAFSSPALSDRGLEAGSARSSRLTPSPGPHHAILSPSDYDSAALSKNNSPTGPAAALEGHANKHEAQPVEEISDLYVNKSGDAGPENAISNGTSKLLGASHAHVSIPSTSASPSSSEQTHAAASPAVAAAHEEDSPIRTAQTNKPVSFPISRQTTPSTRISKQFTSSTGRKSDSAAAILPIKPVEHESKSQSKASNASGDLGKSNTRQAGRYTASPLDSAEQSTSKNTSPVSHPRVRSSLTPVGSKTSTSRLMQATAASRARASSADSQVSPDPGRFRSTTANASGASGTKSNGDSPLASSSISGGTRVASARFRPSNSSPSPLLHTSSSNSHNNTKDEKTMSPAQLGRLAAAEQTGVHIASRTGDSNLNGTVRTRKLSTPVGSGRSRSSMAMAREASHETPTKGAKPDTAISPETAKESIPEASQSKKSNDSPASARKASSVSGAPASVPPSSSPHTSRLTRPTASSLAHARTAETPPPLPPSPSSARATPSSSAKATIGSQVPPMRAQISPLAAMKPGPKIGIVTGPKKIDLKAKVKKPPESGQGAMTSSNKSDMGGKDELRPDESAIPEIPSGAEVAHVESSLSPIPASAQGKNGSVDHALRSPTSPAHQGEDTALANKSATGNPIDTDRIDHYQQHLLNKGGENVPNPPVISEPEQHADVPQPAGKKVFAGFGTDRPAGKIGVSSSPEPARIPPNLDFSDKWGTRDSGNLRSTSPRAVSPAMSPANSTDSQGASEKKTPIWMRKGGE
ncbi:MAG: hypothetical protein CYPHOPRED_003290 [Cyphobasidiales sp. Tagirdzhanova-0007]|nr:MAG: hypothetical protein CYPHOPRED_003290 [Cyphobasidiales sp. Tagirdzhanova-0007]